jgi:ubiquinone/menaquinone biosynthesis C-methylase UbiE
MEHHVCPWWVGYFLISPFRAIAQNPQKILSPFVWTGMNVLEVGPGMGFFTIPLARLVGETGKVHCVDVQEKMLSALKRRAAKKNVLQQIDARLCGETSLGIDDLTGKIDFALVFAVVHETPDRKKFLDEIYRSMKPGSLLLLAEPTGHETEEGFGKTLAIAREIGFEIADRPQIKKSYATVIRKK